MIVNYVVDDIDTVRNYKKQFMRLFARNTFDRVMERLRKKIAAYETETPLHGGPICRASSFVLVIIRIRV
jgi:hypothetical protein